MSQKIDELYVDRKLPDGIRGIKLEITNKIPHNWKISLCTKKFLIEKYMDDKIKIRNEI